jgi:hypothetical protein
MPLQITIPDDEIKYLNPPAITELEVSVRKFSDELLQESSRLEAASKTTNGNPEITSSMVKDATLLLRRGYRKPKKSWWLVVVQIVAVATTFVTGILADFDKLKEPNSMIAFIVFLSIAITTTVLVLFKE